MDQFDKTHYSICGEKIGFSGNREPEEGNLCRDCADEGQKCGKQVAQQPVLGLETKPFETEPLSADREWKCPGCGTENKGKFCSDCGLPIPADNSRICECGMVCKSRFCPECGRQLL